MTKRMELKTYRKHQRAQKGQESFPKKALGLAWVNIWRGNVWQRMKYFGFLYLEASIKRM